MAKTFWAEISFLSPSESLLFTNQAFFLEFCPVSFHLGFLIHFGESRFEVCLNICPYAVCSTIYQVCRPNYALSCISYPLLKIFIFKVEAKVTFFFSGSLLFQRAQKWFVCFRGSGDHLVMTDLLVKWTSYKALRLQLKLPPNRTLNVRDNVFWQIKPIQFNIVTFPNMRAFPHIPEEKKMGYPNLEN